MFIGSRQVPTAVFAATLSALALAGCGGGGGHASNAQASFLLGIFDVSDVNQTTPLLCSEVAGTDFAAFLNGSQVDDGAVTCVGSSAYFQLTTDLVPAGNYTVDLYLYGNPTVYGNSNTIIGSSRIDNVAFAPGFTDYTSAVEPVWTESFDVAWNLVDSSSRIVSCTAGETVQLEFAKPGSSASVVSSFDCNAMAGTSFPIPIDYTSAQWGLFLMNGATTEDALQSTQPVAVPDGADVNLGTQTFVVP